jgi:hypothetical protein
MNKAVVIGGVVIGAACFCGLGLFAAPAIGTWVGSTFLGWSGCAATSSGLAALGGGSLATGGLGMAGGTAVVATTSAAAGGLSSGLITKRIANGRISR